MLTRPLDTRCYYFDCVVTFSCLTGKSQDSEPQGTGFQIPAVILTPCQARRGSRREREREREKEKETKGKRRETGKEGSRRRKKGGRRWGRKGAIASPLIKK